MVVAVSEPPIFAQLRTTQGFEWLREAGRDLRARGINGQTLLHESIAFRKSDAALELIRLGVELDAVNKKGETALHYAAACRDFAVAKSLIAHGARLDITDKFGNEALWAAAMSARGDLEMVITMVSRGANVLHKNNAGKCPLDIATITEDSALLAAMRKP